MRITCKKALSLLFALAMLLTSVASCSLTLFVGAAAGDVLFSENFDSYANGTLPSGWTVTNDWSNTNSPAVSVQNGKLQLNGIGEDLQTRVVYLGSELADKGDYVFEADYTILATKNNVSLASSTRYSSMMFRVSADTYPYYYCTTRVSTGTNNEFSFRRNTDTGSYYKVSQSAPPALQVLNTTYHLKVICRGASVQFYIDDTLALSGTLNTAGTTNYDYLSKGSIGFTTSNMTVAFDNIVVTEAEVVADAQPSMYDTYIPDTDIVNPPSVITNVTNSTIYDKLTGSKTPATSLYYLNSDLDITTADGSVVIASLAKALNFTAGKVIPALYIKDTATADALADFAAQVGLQDAFVVADDPAVLKYARQKNVNFYGVLYNKLSTAATPSDLEDMVKNTNEAWGKTVLVDADYVSKDDVAYMQKRLMNVWVIDDTLTNEKVYANLYKGVNGLVTTDHANVLWIIESGNFNTGTPVIIREPYMYAHRGYSALAPQNTMEAFYEAINYGTDLIEMDVKRTSDGVLVLFHDEHLIGDYYLKGWSDTPLTDCTDETKTVENSTYAEIAALTITENGKSGKIPTLRQFLEFIDDAAEVTDVVGIIEIKAYQEALVKDTAAMVKEMGVEEHVVSICFGQAQCNLMRNELPAVSVGWLANAPYVTDSSGNQVKRNDTRDEFVSYAKGFIMSGNLSYHPNYGEIQSSSYPYSMYDSAVEYAAQRSISFNPWTFNSHGVFDYAYIQGIQGLTTDHLEFDDGYVRKIETGRTYNVQSGVATALQAVGYTSLGKATYNCEFIRTGGAAATVSNANGKVTVTDANGIVTGVLMYKVATNYAGNYYVMSDLVSLNVTSAAPTQVVATAPQYSTLLPDYTAKWQNSVSAYNIDVTREGRGEVLTNTTGEWPAVHHTTAVTASLNDAIHYDITVGDRMSLLVILSNGSVYSLSKAFVGTDSSDFSGDDLIGNGRRFSGTITLSDLIPASEATDGNVTIQTVRVFNIGAAGTEVVIHSLDLVQQVPTRVLKFGDVDNSGVMDTLDARLIIMSAAGTKGLSFEQVEAGDMNYDGVANSSDARAILRLLLEN